MNNKPASECKLPLDTGSMHKWNKAEIGTITFAEAGLQLLTFHYGKGNNFKFSPHFLSHPTKNGQNKSVD